MTSADFVQVSPAYQYRSTWLKKKKNILDPEDILSTDEVKILCWIEWINKPIPLLAFYNISHRITAATLESITKITAETRDWIN